MVLRIREAQAEYAARLPSPERRRISSLAAPFADLAPGGLLQGLDGRRVASGGSRIPSRFAGPPPSPDHRADQPDRRGGATFASLIGGRGEHCHASRGMESGRITRLWPDSLAAIAGMGIRPWPSTQPMGVPELVISCRDSHLVPTFGGRRTLDMVEKGQEMASAGRCRGEDVRQPRRSSCARKPEIPNLVDRFGRSTDDRLAILRDRVEPNLPKDFRDAIAAGPVFNVEDGVIWRDED